MEEPSHSGRRLRGFQKRWMYKEPERGSECVPSIELGWSEGRDQTRETVMEDPNWSPISHLLIQ